MKLLKNLQHSLTQYMPPMGYRKVIVGVSGGKDSIALLHALTQLRYTNQLSLTVATLNHGIRPNAHQDVMLVERLCHDWHVPCITETVNVPHLAKQNKQGLEVTSRQARYTFFSQVLTQTQSTVLMTAHHADDQAETLLMHLLRGAGLKGLQAMKPLTPLPEHPEFWLLRPLVTTSRADIEDYIEQNQLPFHEDETNSDTLYTRNRIRLELLPTLESYNPKIKDILARLANTAQVHQAFMDEQFHKQIMPHIQISEHAWQVELARFQEWHEALQREYLLQAFEALADTQVLLTAEHVQQALIFITRDDASKTLELGGGVFLQIWNKNKDTRVVRVYQSIQDILALYPLWQGNEQQVIFDEWIEVENWRIMFTRTPSKDSIATFNVGLDEAIYIRNRQPGDKIYLLHMHGKSKRVKDWMIEQRIPKEVRDNLPVIATKLYVLGILVQGKFYESVSPEYLNAKTKEVNSIAMYINLLPIKPK
jgi:tRNA(Ile)-lysidine synthase